MAGEEEGVMNLNIMMPIKVTQINDDNAWECPTCFCLVTDRQHVLNMSDACPKCGTPLIEFQLREDILKGIRHEYRCDTEFISTANKYNIKVCTGEGV